jgi:putative hydrolase of the HAD superfamily
MTVVVFDLDDTLYDEMSYVRSGFRAVAAFMEQSFGVPSVDAYGVMIDSLERLGRGQVFDEALKKFSVFTQTRVKACLTVYRRHYPDIALDPEALSCFHRLRSYPLYLVTDGNKLVQGNKVKALGLEEIMRRCFVTHRYGKQHAKPSPYLFHKICSIERTVPSKVIYIGDNPNKDFVGIKRDGFRTVRIRRGMFQSVSRSEEYEAHVEISTLEELTERLIHQLVKRPVQEAML